VPEILRSAVLVVQQEIPLPMSPPAYVTGRGTDGEIVCHVYFTATGLGVYGPGDRKIKEMTWEQLVDQIQK
jgi:hypothetical protein